MFSKTNKKAEAVALTGAPPAKKSVPSIISADLSILGNLISEGLIDVDGRVEGNVKADQVTVRANGKVHGDVVANVAHIYGEVCGIIRAQTVFLYSTCHIEGVVMHHSLTVEDGAFIDGKFKRMQDKTAMGGSIQMSDDSSMMLDDEEDDGAHPNSLRLIG